MIDLNMFRERALDELHEGHTEMQLKIESVFWFISRVEKLEADRAVAVDFLRRIDGLLCFSEVPTILKQIGEI